MLKSKLKEKIFVLIDSIANNNSSIVNDWRDRDYHPLEAVYRSNGKSFILNIPVRDFVYSPLVDTWVKVFRAMNNGLSKEEYSKILKEYYKNYQPKNIAEVLRIKNYNKNSWLANNPLGYFFPWSNTISYSHAIRNRREGYRNEALYHGFRIERKNDWKEFGPGSDSMIEFELSRLENIFYLIQTNGFDEKYGLFRGQIFCRSKSIFINIDLNWHRYAYFKALKYPFIPTKFLGNSLVVRRNDVDYWPGVKRGLFTKEQALEVFDNKIFSNKEILGSNL